MMQLPRSPDAVNTTGSRGDFLFNDVPQEFENEVHTAEPEESIDSAAPILARRGSPLCTSTKRAYMLSTLLRAIIRPWRGRC